MQSTTGMPDMSFPPLIHLPRQNWLAELEITGALAIAVATFWVASVGDEADASPPCCGLEALPELHIARRTGRANAHGSDLQSCFAQRGLSSYDVVEIQSMSVCQDFR
jgi:hypothetical protein